MTIIQQLAERLRNIAINDHKQYPQYANHFDNWVLANANTERVLKYKGGSRLVDGRWVLASPDLTNWYDPDTGNICVVDAGVLVKV